MTDADLKARLWALKEQGESALPDLRALLKEVGFARIIGLIPKPRAKRVSTAVSTYLPDDFPNDAAKARATAYWRQNGRDDLSANVEKIAEDFRRHHRPDLEGHGTKVKSWPQTWATWYRNQVEFTRRQGGRSPDPVVAFQQTNRSGWVGRLTIFHEGADGLPPGYWGEKWGPKPGDNGCKVPEDVMRQYGVAGQELKERLT